MGFHNCQENHIIKSLTYFEILKTILEIFINILLKSMNFHKNEGDRSGGNRMVFGFTITYVIDTYHH